ncbi:hypothetical protein HS7_11990 [Sulfolobales archaeon HS-7]|nr:hypothetical protein HS7_11990 [Sulfolobales archaeon HS-7]
MIGIDALDYGYFLKCRLKVLSTLFNTAYRGVVENELYMDTVASWKRVLNVGDENPLIRDPRIEFANIPLEEKKTIGKISIPYDKSIPLEKELEMVTEFVSSEIEEKALVVDITAIGRGAYDSICNAYEKIDSSLTKLLKKADNFLIMSPYGINPKGTRNKFGVFISTFPRPKEHETVKIEEVGKFFLTLIQP